MQLLLVLALLAGGYLLACQIWPYKPCRRCHGGKQPSPSRKAWRACGRCGGTGRRVRFFAHKP